MHPDKYEKAVQPDIFVFLLVAYENVFASIAFEQIPELIERLYDLAVKGGIDLNAIPCGHEAEKWQPRIGKIVKNMWLLPFSLFEDLATVTLIGKKPRVRPDIISGQGGSRLCTASIQEQRYDRLVLSSRDRPHIDADEEFYRAFVGDEADHFFAIIDHDLEILENTDFDTCFSCLARYNRSKGRVLNCLHWIMRCMLAHENPSRESEGKCYVPLSYEWLKNWCEQYGQKRKIDTWFHNIKLAIMFELLEYYRPSRTSLNPIDQMVNASNEFPNSVGYYTPVKLTREKLLQADWIAQNYTLDNIKTSQISKDVLLDEEEEFDKVDDAFGSDGRKKALAKKYVKNLFEITITNMICEHGFALPSEVCKNVKMTMKREKRLWYINPTKEFTEEGKKEKARQKPYWNEFNRLTKNMKELAESLNYTYKQLSEENKVWLEKARTLPTGTRIIRVRDIPDWDYAKVFQFRIEKKKPKIRLEEKNMLKKSRKQQIIIFSNRSSFGVALKL